MAAHAVIRQPDVDEEQNPDVIQARNVGIKAAVGTVTYPLTFAKTLWQLGYEPYPLNPGKTFFYFGRDAYFLPNAFKYLHNIYKEHGVGAIYRGVEAGILSTVVGGMTSYYAIKYLDEHYKDVGGAPENVGIPEDQLSDYDSFRVHFRQAIRDTIGKAAGAVVAHPFTVLMIREIAQHVGGECKYKNAICGLLRLGDEEGPSGLFSGLVPLLIADFIFVWGSAALTYGTQRLFLKLEKHDDDARNTVQELRKVTPYLIPFVVSSFTYSFHVCTTLLAVTGSHLAVSMLPYTPQFTHWGDAYSYLNPYGLTRGSRVFLREHKGAVTVKSDRVFADNKYFL